MMFEPERQILRVNNVRVRYGQAEDKDGQPVFELTLWDPATGKKPSTILIAVDVAEHFATELAAAAAVIRASLV